MAKIEAWLYRTFPVLFADGISSFCHGVMVAAPTLLIGKFVNPVLGVMVGSWIAGWYWNREDHDVVKARRIEQPYRRGQKIADSARDRWVPHLFLVMSSLMVLFS